MSEKFSTPSIDQLQTVISQIGADKIRTRPLERLVAGANEMAENTRYENEGYVDGQHVTQLATGRTEELLGQTGEVADFDITNYNTLDAGDVNNRIKEMIEGRLSWADADAKEALETWNNLSVNAVEKLRISAESTNQQAEALVAADQVVDKHLKVSQRRDVLASTVISLIQRPKEGLHGIITTDWRTYRDQANFAGPVTVEVLKTHPDFQSYRDALIAEVQQLDESSNVDLKKDWKNPLKVVKNLWSKAVIASKIGVNGEAQQALKDDVFNKSRKLRAATAELDTLPTLDDSQNYLAEYGKFLNEAGQAVNNINVLNALPAAGETAIARQNQAVKADYDKSYNEAYDAVKAEKDAADEVLRVQQEEKAAIEARNLAKTLREARELAELKNARADLKEFSMEANALASTAASHRDMAITALTGLAEYNYVERKMEEVDQLIKDGKLPEVFGAVNSDIGAEVDTFIKTKGKKGDVRAVLTLVQGLELTAQEPGVESKLPTAFHTLNTFTELDANDNVSRQLETGLLVETDIDGRLSIRLATRTGEDIQADPNLPALRLDRQALLGSFTSIDNSERDLAQAQQQVDGLESSLHFARGTRGVDSQLKKQLKTAQDAVQLHTLTLAARRAELATLLQSTSESKTMSGAFKAMTESQRAIAKEFYGKDLNDAVLELAKDIDAKPSEITVEVMATVAASAEQASVQAAEMAEYFDKASIPGLIQREVLEKRRAEIEELGAEYAKIQDDASEIEKRSTEALKVEGRKVLRKATKALDIKANELVVNLQSDFVEAVPLPLREGSSKIGLTKTQLRADVTSNIKLAFSRRDENENIVYTGYDSADYQKMAKKGKNKGKTTAQVIYSTLPYDAEVKDLADSSLDALRLLRHTNEAETLLDALRDGDIETFQKGADQIINETKVSELSGYESRRNADALAELLKTPEGIAAAIENGTLTIQSAIDAIMNGSADTQDVMTALRGASPEARNEAARRLYAEINLLDTPFDALTEPDPLAGRSDVAAMAAFIKDQPVGSNALSHWQTYIDRATAEKKTTVV